MTLNDIKQLIKDKIKEISEIFGVPDDEALVLLNHFKWRKDLLENEWFGNEDKIYKKTGLEPNLRAEVSKSPEILCPMCFDTKPRAEFDCLKCNHQICKECWADFITYQVHISTPINI